MFFAKSKFRTKMVILAGLEAILGPLGTILEPPGAVLGRSWDFRAISGGPWGGRTGSRSARLECFGPPPLPKLLAKANSD